MVDRDLDQAFGKMRTAAVRKSERRHSRYRIDRAVLV